MEFKKFEKGNISIYLADNMELLPTFKEDEFDLAIVDPPYGLGDTKLTSGGTWASKYEKGECDWDVPPTPEYFKELFRVSKNQFIFGGNYFALPANRHFIVWYKPQMQGMHTMSDVEYIWSSLDANAKMVPINNTGYKRVHPTQKPINLYKWLLTHYAKKGDRILDTHGGSFSSAIACWELGFEYVGIDNKEKYFNEGVNRLNNCNQPSLEYYMDIK